REALPLAERRASDARIGELILAGFPMLAKMTIGFYWPIKGEVDPRVTLHRLRERGARTALPVVVAKGEPLRFLEWRPETPTVPGPMGLPIPQGSDVLVPDAVLAPPVGFGALGYRLGYGAGFFDRTLAAAHPRPLALGLAREMSRMETIHPQAWDIPMDFILTEAGIHVAGGAPLRRLEDSAEAAAIAREIIASRVAA
ncbi:MAG TPA: 5-formyltetrahydrofolate cyclo-ligase, partial [Usitatibacter sp.]|nr:5-formyltetrahydrofolate cyclo-ligase [Usitatibacter sp.]